MRRMMRYILCFTLVLAIALAASPAQAWWIFGGGDQAVSAPAVTPEPSAVPATAPTVGATPAGAALPAPTPEAVDTQEQAALRVRLKSLGQIEALGLTLVGSYSVENDAGFRFADETDIAVAVDGADLLMSVGGLTINMGPSMTLTRHLVEAGALCGAMIHETGRENLYCGDLSLKNTGGAIDVVVTLDVEDYLYGVLPYEMSDSFPLEALKAQAVAARTYAMSRKNPGREYDVVDTTDDQVFRGLDPDTENTFIAVDETRGVVGRYKDGYATCFFTASNGGQTELPQHIWGGDGDYGYLDVIDDPYDLENPSSPVKSLTLSADPAALDKHLTQVLKSDLTEQMSALGYSDEVEDIRIVSLVSMAPADPKFGEGNRMYRALRVGMRVEGKRLYAPDPTPDAQTTPLNLVEMLPETLYADIDFYGDLKPNYGLKVSGLDCEVLSVTALKQGETAGEGEAPDSFLIESRRFGHGVGMSQRGAQQMAGAHGMTWTQILTFYYPGMTLVKMDYARQALTALEALPKSVGYARARPTPKPTPAPLPALQQGESYATAQLGSKSSTLNVREEPNTTSRIVGTLDHGQRLIVVAQAGAGWARIRTTELEGYCSTDYLKGDGK